MRRTRLGWILELVVLVLAAAGCRQAPGTMDLGRARVVDLTYTFDSTTVYWPTETAGFKLTRLAHGRGRLGRAAPNRGLATVDSAAAPAAP